MGWRDRRKNAAARLRKRKFELRDASDPRGIAALAAAFLEWMAARNYAEATRYHRERYLDQFMSWCEMRGITRAAEVTKPILERYQRWLYHYRKPNGEPLSFVSQNGRLVGVKAFFKWLARQNHILYNPASDIELPRLEMRLPKYVLTEHEAERVVAQAVVGAPNGIRDRAILETFYSTGIRRAEMAHLKRYDLDAERGTVMVRQGKGKRDRVIPIGDRAVSWIDRYLVGDRRQLVVEPDEGWLFLTSRGDSFTPEGLSDLVRRYVKASGIAKHGACHLFRHTMATLMLENGADIRFIQQMLGHAKITTTEIYTQVSIRKLKEIHRATHPARLEQAATASKLAPDDPATRAQVEDLDDREDLLTSLAEEAAGEDDVRGTPE